MNTPPVIPPETETKMKVRWLVLIIIALLAAAALGSDEGGTLIKEWWGFING